MTVLVGMAMLHSLVKIGPFYPIFTLGKLALPSFYPPSDAGHPQGGKNGVKLLAGC